MSLAHFPIETVKVVYTFTDLEKVVLEYSSGICSLSSGTGALHYTYPVALGKSLARKALNIYSELEQATSSR